MHLYDSSLEKISLTNIRRSEVIQKYCYFSSCQPEKLLSSSFLHHQQLETSSKSCFFSCILSGPPCNPVTEITLVMDMQKYLTYCVKKIKAIFKFCREEVKKIKLFLKLFFSFDHRALKRLITMLIASILYYKINNLNSKTYHSALLLGVLYLLLSRRSFHPVKHLAILIHLIASVSMPEISQRTSLRFLG